MKFITPIFTFLFCMITISGCSIYTVTCKETENLPKSQLLELPYPLYVTTVKINNKEQSAPAFRRNLSKRYPKIFTNQVQKGVPAEILLNGRHEYESGTLNTLALLTLTIFPLSSYETDNFQMELTVGEIKGESTFQYSTHGITGLTPLTYIAYPFVGWFADKKTLASPAPFSADAPYVDKFLLAASSQLDSKKIKEYYGRRPKTITPKGLEDAKEQRRKK